MSTGSKSSAVALGVGTFFGVAFAATLALWPASPPPKPKEDALKRNPFQFTVLNNQVNKTSDALQKSLSDYSEHRIPLDKKGAEAINRAIKIASDENLKILDKERETRAAEIDFLFPQTHKGEQFSDDPVCYFSRTLLKGRLFVFDFDHNGETSLATSIKLLRQFVNMIVCIGTPGKDRVLIRINSPGGSVVEYGFVASLLMTLRNKQFYVTASVDQMALSAGYLMACTAHRIIAAPLAFVGSIGVVVEHFNYSRLMKKYDVDYHMHTAGDEKRNVSEYGHMDEESIAKLKRQLERTHKVFKDQVIRYRPHVDIDKIGNGDHWIATECHSNGLIDDIMTSDEFITSMFSQYTVVLVSPLPKKEEDSSMFGSVMDWMFGEEPEEEESSRSSLFKSSRYLTRLLLGKHSRARMMARSDSQ
jgi:serine protease SohB